MTRAGSQRHSKKKSLLFTWCTNSLTFNICTLCPRCIYMFCIYLRTNSDLCHLQHKLIGFYNRDEKCLLRGTDWVFRYRSLRFVFKGLNVFFRNDWWGAFFFNLQLLGRYAVWLENPFEFFLKILMFLSIKVSGATPQTANPRKATDNCNNETVVFWDVTSRGLVGGYRNHDVTTHILSSEKFRF